MAARPACVLKRCQGKRGCLCPSTSRNVGGSTASAAQPAVAVRGGGDGLEFVVKAISPVAVVAPSTSQSSKPGKRASAAMTSRASAATAVSSRAGRGVKGAAVSGPPAAGTSSAVAAPRRSGTSRTYHSEAKVGATQAPTGLPKPTNPLAGADGVDTTLQIAEQACVAVEGPFNVSDSTVNGEVGSAEAPVGSGGGTVILRYK
jgi:hypothetical protein